MKKLLLLISIITLLSSCSSTSLYYWGKQTNGISAYSEYAYQYNDKIADETLCKLICTYEDIINNPTGLRQVPPPGICAEYAYLLLQPSTQTIFDKVASSRQKRIFAESKYGSTYQEKIKKLLEYELQLYPESKQFIEPLIKKFVQ